MTIVTLLTDFGTADSYVAEMKGVLSTSNVIFYLSLAFVGIFLTYRSVDSLRWRG